MRCLGQGDAQIVQLFRARTVFTCCAFPKACYCSSSNDCPMHGSLSCCSCSRNVVAMRSCHKGTRIYTLLTCPTPAEKSAENSVSIIYPLVSVGTEPTHLFTVVAERTQERYGLRAEGGYRRPKRNLVPRSLLGFYLAWSTK